MRLITLILIALALISVLLVNKQHFGEFSKVQTLESAPSLKTSSALVFSGLPGEYSVAPSRSSDSVISNHEVDINTISPWGVMKPNDEARLESALQAKKTKEHLLANRLSQLEHLMTETLSEQDSFKYQEEWTRLKHTQLELPMPSANPYWFSFEEARTPITSTTETNAKAQ